MKGRPPMDGDPSHWRETQSIPMFRATGGAGTQPLAGNATLAVIRRDRLLAL